MDNKYIASSETFQEKALRWNLGQWVSECAILSPSQFLELIPLATPHYDAHHWKEKLHQLFLRISNDANLETFAKALNAIQILEIMHFIKHSSDDLFQRQKLSSLFAHLHPAIFKEIILEASQEELNFLREEAITEVIQHNLSLIASDLSTSFSNFCDRISALEIELEKADLQEMDKTSIESLYESIEDLRKENEDMLQFLNKVLTVVWNTNRGDLIQELGRTKELCQKCLIETIGKAAEEEIPSSGIWHILEKNVEKNFSDWDANGNQSIMKDSIPALEAFVKFSVWNIQDYYEVGLLPQMTSLNKTNEMINLKNREQLFTEVEKNLNKMGLKTLSDLKSAKIYSRKALMEYINAFYNQLTD